MMFVLMLMNVLENHLAEKMRLLFGICREQKLVPFDCCISSYWLNK